MIFERKIMSKLEEWKKYSDGSKAVLIEGARRIGKSTVAEEFAKKHYKSYIIIDFAFASDNIKNAFRHHLLNLDDFFMIISSEYNTPLYKRQSVIIFDEIQLFPKAREAIKLLVKDRRYDYIETGSLISIKENVKEILIPSEEHPIKMYPMDFEEFCLAMGDNQIINYIRECFSQKKPLLEAIHKKASFLFMQYILIGGMPKVVSSFIESGKQFEMCSFEKNDILNLYRNDINKIDDRYKAKVLSIFDGLPGFLSSHEKRVKINSFDETNRAVSYEESFFWLADSMICNECFLCNDPNVGLSLNENKSFIKCYMGDTGLLVTHSFDENAITEQNIYSKILTGHLSINKGMLFENVIAQMLTANGHKLYFYTCYNKEKHRNDIEIDFLLSNKDKTNLKIYPIEVKSSKKYTTVSLERFIDKYHDRIGCAYIIHPQNLTAPHDKLLCIPPYMTICL